jgi:hypothetical protein
MYAWARRTNDYPRVNTGSYAFAHPTDLTHPWNLAGTRAWRMGERPET